MAFVAPAAGRVAAGAAARSAGARAGTRAAVKVATPPTAPARAGQLLSQGKTRADAARILRDEYGSTVSEARGLLADQSPGGTGGTSRTTPPASSGTTRAPARLPSPPRVVRRTADAAGGVILGVLAYVLTLTYLRGGPAGVKRWLAAKFLNRVDGEAS